MTDESIELSDEERTPCEVWTRVMGYHRPVSAFNAGKQREHKDRKTFREACCAEKVEGISHEPSLPRPPL